MTLDHKDYTRRELASMSRCMDQELKMWDEIDVLKIDTHQSVWNSPKYRMLVADIKRKYGCPNQGNITEGEKYERQKEQAKVEAPQPQSL